MNSVYLSNEALMDSLIKDGYLKTPAVIEAFKKIDRKDFVPEEYKKEAYGNYPLSIGFGQTISQPLTVAFMLELLEVKEGNKILEIGTGSGWQTGLLSALVGESGKVISIERLQDLAKLAESNLEKYEFKKGGALNLLVGDGSKGYPSEAPFDRIISAAAAEKIPEAWKDQLKVHGRIVAPLKESVVVIEKTGPEEFTQKEYFGFSFVPLVVDK